MIQFNKFYDIIIISYIKKKYDVEMIKCIHVRNKQDNVFRLNKFNNIFNYFFDATEKNHHVHIYIFIQNFNMYGETC